MSIKKRLETLENFMRVSGGAIQNYTRDDLAKMDIEELNNIYRDLISGEQIAIRSTNVRTERPHTETPVEKMTVEQVADCYAWAVM
ncbi:TPA: hypothetical protein ACIUKL_002076 [Salmonella enterica subsp. enterica serovar 4,5,12:b:-]|uniref:Uncharacterized protein n=3 Tax=Salmonella enterica I TaxID=59201 RepID=A0A738YPT3_SALET|nr:hypothetical protein [Salmonella enterica subsp. enterica]EAP3270660.1 hypothetical protein [Salmonella enterica]ECF4502126.1 hypothetical protein [Salmonella enterica subsp. enterica serovar Javiana]EGI6247631.1 hypothetical protein [Salmonella enterica subsp. enterica serovar Orientalis]EKQ9749705.1 hypothetical protein [Salmonella enterica subsp. enterica serovar 4,[5],12:b:-]QVP99598.1 hypothetical protein CAI54_21965 [Salmonella enterica subsp. enterica serovar Paratyphi B str. CFSAN00